MEDKVEEEVDDTFEKVYPKGRAELVKERRQKAWDRILRVLSFFRWVWNFIFNFIPWFWFSALMIVVNLILNMALNNFWAEGNLGLILNTWYLIIQTVMSWILVIEIPVLLKSKVYGVIRWISASTSVIYMMFYFFIIGDWIYELWLESEDTYYNYQLIDVIFNMYMAYNIIFNLHILPVNMQIIWKEFWLLVFPPLLDTDKKGASLATLHNA